MPSESTRTPANAGKKKAAKRRKKKVRSTGQPEEQEDTSPGASGPTEATTQIDVGDVTRAANKRTAGSGNDETASSPTKKGRKKSVRRTKKKAIATDKSQDADGRTKNLSTIAEDKPEKTGRKRRRKKAPRISPDVVDSTPDAQPLEILDEPEATDRIAESAETWSADIDPIPQERSKSDAPEARDQDRPRRRRGRRGGRASSRAGSDRSVEGSAEENEREEELVEETEDAVEVGDVTFPKPDLAERCKREMIINVTGGEECRIAILQDKRLEELFIERASSQSHVGNIYKGRVTNVEPSIQAAFVDFGLTKNGFLHISDVQPQYFPEHRMEKEDVGRKIPRHHRPPIQKCFRRGQEVMVQITKEGVGTKGPTLTTYLSIPGRFLVMMPGMNRHGVSRKIEDDQERRKMKDVMGELTFPPGMGFILRTAGMGQTKRELQRDLNYLVRLWKRVVDRVKSLPSPAELYRESDLVTRTIRDVYSVEFDRLIVDDPVSARKAKDFFQIAMPRSKPRIEAYTDPQPIFHALGIEEEIERINARHVPLRSGGSLVIDSTEALVAIDVNSGRFRVPDDAEETALRINVEAADEIARQLRLRDLGGLIVCDFIDMRFDRNKRAVERALRDALKKHKERARILRMSAFGLIEMTRQRQGPSLKRNIYFDCPHCHGSGLVKMPESVILDVMRSIQLAAHHKEVRQIRVTVSTEVAHQILNTKRTAISTIESATRKRVFIQGDLNFTSDQVECLCEDDRGQPIMVSGVDTHPTSTPRGKPSR